MSSVRILQRQKLKSLCGRSSSRGILTQFSIIYLLTGGKRGIDRFNHFSLLVAFFSTALLPTSRMPALFPLFHHHPFLLSSFVLWLFRIGTFTQTLGIVSSSLLTALCSILHLPSAPSIETGTECTVQY